VGQPGARPAALALLALLAPGLSCSATGGATPLVATVPPATATSGAPSAASRARKAAAAEDMSCEPAMFMDHPPGTRGLWAFEDPSSGLYGYRDQGGAVRIPARFQFAYEFAPEGVTGAIDGGKPVFIDTTGKVLAEAFLEDNGPDYFVAGLARIVEGGKIGFLSASGQVAIAPRLDGAGPFCEGLAVACVGCTRRTVGEHREYVGGRWGFVDRQGRWAIPARYDAAEPFSDGRAEVVQADRRVVIDRSGRAVAPDGAAGR
jgi:hypothetical protein